MAATETVSPPPAPAPLDPAAREIRLVELLPGTGDEAIRCRLRRCALVDAPSYVALSYTWGRQEAYKDILLDDAAFSLSRNLWSFLHHARLPKEPSLLWIDALCIDQSNTQERNEQAQLMPQIYSQATSVSVWLGEADSFTESNIAMDYILRQGSKPLRRIGYGGIKPLWTERQGRSLLALFERNFWRRLWVVQEVMHARELNVYCGAKYFRWRSLQKLFGKLKIIAKGGRVEHYRHVAAVLDSPARKLVDAKADWTGHPIPLQTLLTECVDLQCTEVRDRVFSLVGLASDASLVTLDYALSPKDILYDALNNIANTYHPTSGNEATEFGKCLRDALRVHLPDEQLRSMVLSSMHDAWEVQRNHSAFSSNHPILPTSPSLLLDPKSLADLGAHCDRLMYSIQQRWEALNMETQRVRIPYAGADNSAEVTDAEIQRFRDILRKIDELEVEFEKIRQIGEYVKGFRARIETLDRRV